MSSLIGMNPRSPEIKCTAMASRRLARSLCRHSTRRKGTFWIPESWREEQATTKHKVIDSEANTCSRKSSLRSDRRITSCVSGGAERQIVEKPKKKISFGTESISSNAIKESIKMPQDTSGRKCEMAKKIDCESSDTDSFASTLLDPQITLDADTTHNAATKLFPQTNCIYAEQETSDYESDETTREIQRLCGTENNHTRLQSSERASRQNEGNISAPDNDVSGKHQFLHQQNHPGAGGLPRKFVNLTPGANALSQIPVEHMNLFPSDFRPRSRTTPARAHDRLYSSIQKLKPKHMSVEQQGTKTCELFKPNITQSPHRTATWNYSNSKIKSNSIHFDSDVNHVETPIISRRTMFGNSAVSNRVMRKSTVKKSLLRVKVSGWGSVGKTSLISQLCSPTYANPFEIAHKAGAINGAVSVLLDNEEYIVQLTETDLMTELQNFDGQTDHDAHIFIYCVDSPASLLLVEEALSLLRTVNKDRFAIIVENKVDLVRKRLVSTAEGLNAAKTHGCDFKQVSVVLDHGVDDILSCLVANSNKAIMTKSKSGKKRSQSFRRPSRETTGKQPLNRLELSWKIRFLNRFGSMDKDDSSIKVAKPPYDTDSKRTMTALEKSEMLESVNSELSAPRARSMTVGHKTININNWVKPDQFTDSKNCYRNHSPCMSNRRMFFDATKDTIPSQHGETKLMENLCNLTNSPCLSNRRKLSTSNEDYITSSMGERYYGTSQHDSCYHTPRSTRRDIPAIGTNFPTTITNNNAPSTKCDSSGDSSGFVSGTSSDSAPSSRRSSWESDKISTSASGRHDVSAHCVSNHKCCVHCKSRAADNKKSAALLGCFGRDTTA